MSGAPSSRREALARLGRASAGVAAALPLSGCAAGLFRGRGGAGEVRVATLPEVPPGTVLRAAFRDQPVLVVNVDGRIRVLSGLCTHEACELGWNAAQRLIRCPCHGSAFQPDGRVRLGPAQEPLPEYPSRIAGGGVFVTEPDPDRADGRPTAPPHPDAAVPLRRSAEHPEQERVPLPIG